MLRRRRIQRRDWRAWDGRDGKVRVGPALKRRMWWRLVVYHNRWSWCRCCGGGGRYVLWLWRVRGASRAVSGKVGMLAALLWVLGRVLKGGRGRRGTKSVAGLASATGTTIAGTAVAAIAGAGYGGAIAPGHKAADPRELAGSCYRLWRQGHALLLRALAPRLETVRIGVIGWHWWWGQGGKEWLCCRIWGGKKKGTEGFLFCCF